MRSKIKILDIGQRWTRWSVYRANHQEYSSVDIKYDHSKEDVLLNFGDVTDKRSINQLEYPSAVHLERRAVNHWIKHGIDEARYNESISSSLRSRRTFQSRMSNARMILIRYHQRGQGDQRRKESHKKNPRTSDNKSIQYLKSYQ